MGGAKPWPTRWPEPHRRRFDPNDPFDPMEDPDYVIETDPSEPPQRLPEEYFDPYAVTWGVTSRCNSHCSHCYDAMSSCRRDLSTSQGLRVIDSLSEARIRLVIFSGGEPLLRRDLFELMAYSRQSGLEIGMRSNGIEITPEIARELSKLELCVAGISLDGSTSQSHNAYRGVGSFERTIAGIHELVDVGIRVNIETVLRKSNIYESLEMIELAENLGVQEINFSALVPQGRATKTKNELLDFDEWQEVTEKLYYASLTSKVSISPSCALVGRCSACVEPNITCDGWVTPCYLSSLKLFNILDKKEPLEIKNNLLANRGRTLEICGRARWAHYSNDLIEQNEELVLA